MHESSNTSSKHETTVVVFAVADDLYAIPASCTREVMQWRQPRTLPGAPPWVEGVVNLRGAIIPVCDLAQSLGLRAERRRTDDTSIIIVDADERGGETAGFTVDSVRAVTSYRDEDIVDTPDASYPAMSGIVRTGDELVVLLDIRRALEGTAAAAAAQLQELTSAVADAIADQEDTPGADEHLDERNAA